MSTHERSSMYLHVKVGNTPYATLARCMLGIFSFFCCFKINFFKKKILQKHLQNVKRFESKSEHQSVKTVYNQMTKVANSKGRVSFTYMSFSCSRLLLVVGVGSTLDSGSRNNNSSVRRGYGSIGISSRRSKRLIS